MHRTIRFAAAALLLVLAGCASWIAPGEVKQTGSVVDYLYPNAKEAPQLQPQVTYLRPPIRVGLAFVPGDSIAGLPEAEKLQLLQRIRAAFARYDFIGNIEVIPTSYLRPKGGFENLEQVARMFNVEVMALVSYDQVQFNDSNALGVLYWTIVGAYVIHGDRYDVQTLVDASVFDVRTHTLLFRAPGTSRTRGSASMAGFSEKARAARLAGYNEAVDQLIPNLDNALATFKERIKSDRAFQVENKPGYSGGGSLDGWWLALAGIVLLIGSYTRRRS